MLLRNGTYDGVLRLTLPQDIKLVGFVDDIPVVVYGKSIEDLIGIARDKLETAGKRLPQTVANNHKSEHNETMVPDPQNYGPGILIIMDGSKLNTSRVENS